MRSNAWPEAAAGLLAASFLEASWITLVYVLVESLAASGAAPLSMLTFAGAAVAGMGFVRWSTGGRRPYRTPLAAIAVAVALFGWLVPLGPAAAADLLDDPAFAFGMHPGGILLGLAFVRGTAHATRVDDEGIAEFALGPGLAAVAGLWVLLAASGGTAVAWVADAAFAATLTYVTAGLLSIGLARLADLRGAGVRDADRRIWGGVLVGVIVLLLVVTLPLAMILGVPMGGAVRGAAEVAAGVFVIVAIPFIWVGALLGTALFLAIEFLRGLAGGRATDPGDFTGGPLVDWQVLLGAGHQEGLALGVIPLVVALVVAFLVIRAFVSRPRRAVVDGEVVEIRELQRPTGMRFRAPRLRTPRRHLAPRTASEAYLASLELLAGRPESARLTSETPTEHARRIRADPLGGPLGRLAADYALAEFGNRKLTLSEHRRAIERWRQLRSTDATRD